ncbi:aminotransferase class V-fold PLP-dependent enzyme [Candidatus Micrarchaeota archaeon]|nr:aminotransferase class V-fold PLP-dependent enzyme [Candidatus Micrarchaeota archaeon]
MNEKLRSDFPLLTKNPDLIYLDSACTSLKPQQVIDSERNYYENLGACGGRSSHALGRKTTEAVDSARENVAKFVGAESGELIWTKNTTEALNIVANGFLKAIDSKKDNKKKVVTTVLEHHSLLLPFMKLRDSGKITLEILGCDKDGWIPLELWEEKIDRTTALVVTNNGNNTTGNNQSIDKITKIAHENGAFVCIDGAQGVPHHKADFKKQNFDFLCFSGHKMLGPTGIGALIAKKELIRKMGSLLVGGGTVKTVSIDNVVQMQDSTKFEAGIQNYSGIIGFSAACDYLRKIGMDKIENHETALAQELKKQLTDARVRIYGERSGEDKEKNKNHAALYSFNFENAKAHDVALMLDQNKIAVRSGFFCAQPGMEALGAKDGAVRASCYLYNTVDEVKRFGDALQKIGKLYD